jgi:hypothetical protein
MTSTPFKHHLRLPRVLVTLLYLLYLLWLRATDRGDGLLEMLLLLALGGGLALAWFVVALRAWLSQKQWAVLRAFVLEGVVAVAFLAFCLSPLPFQLAFPLSRPALERFVQEPQPAGPRQVGLLRVLAVRRQHSDGHLALLIHSNLSYAHTLVWYPEREHRWFTWENGFLGSQWSLFSGGM